MDKQSQIVNSHNDRQKISELSCARRWLAVYNQINQTGYCCLRANYFQSEVDVYAYRIDESGQPLRLQVTRARFDSLATAIRRKRGLYSPKQKADLFLLLDFFGALQPNKLAIWQKEHLKLLAESGFLEIWLVTQKKKAVSLWPGLT